MVEREWGGCAMVGVCACVVGIESRREEETILGEMMSLDRRCWLHTTCAIPAQHRSRHCGATPPSDPRSLDPDSILNVVL